MYIKANANERSTFLNPINEEILIFFVIFCTFLKIKKKNKLKEKNRQFIKDFQKNLFISVLNGAYLSRNRDGAREIIVEVLKNGFRSR